MALAKTPKKNTSKSPVYTQPAGKPGQTSEYAPPVYSPAAGIEALEALESELVNIPDADLGNLRVDVEAATYAALGVAGFVAAPEVNARFAKLPKDEFDMTSVTGLEGACFATLYALFEARSAGALESEARIAPEIVAEATEIESRMQALCEYHFADDTEIRPELDRLRPGVGHRDLANDLLGYARIYDLRASAVKADSKYYRAADAGRARELAGIFIQALSAASTPRARAAYTKYARAWTVLSRRYEEVRAAGLWLFRADATREDRFPSLFAAGRSAGRPKKNSGAGTNGEVPDINPTPASNPATPSPSPDNHSPG